MNNDLIQVDGKFYKKCKVVMLTTEEPSKLIKEDDILKPHPSKIDVGIKQYQNLFILSDEEIKELP